MVNTHIHITGEPLTRGYVPDDTSFEENVFNWLCPLYAAHGEEDEATSAQLAAAEMLKSGTTAFVEAGTVWFVDAVIDALEGIGIRARVGRWAWDLPPEPAKYRQTTDEAIRNIERVLDQHGSRADGRIQAWSMVIGHTTCTDTLWRAARALADQHRAGLNFHMSPAAMDPDGFLKTFGERPMMHLERLGVLDERTMLVHCVHVDDQEVEILARRQCGMLAADELGSIEVGKKADLVLHDRNRPEWTPLLNVANQLVYAADGRSVHTVLVDGRKVVEDYRLTTLDEADLYRRAQTAAEAIVARSGLPLRTQWAVV
jgi:cytosine/adenosine deaminase-related metal-dependent hydrolase